MALNSSRFSTPLDPLVAALRRLTPVSSDDAEAIAALPHDTREAAQGETLIEIGSQSDCCCLLVSAYAYKHKVSARGMRQIIAINLPGELLNVQHALAWETDYNSDVLRAGTIALIPRAALRELIFTRPGVARGLWLSTLAEGALSREWLLNVTRRDLTARIAHLLCETSLRMGVTGGADHDRYRVPLSPGQIASAAGSIQLYTQQALDEPEALGAVRVNEEHVEIADWSSLASAGEFDPQYLFEYRSPALRAGQS